MTADFWVGFWMTGAFVALGVAGHVAFELRAARRRYMDLLAKRAEASERPAAGWEQWNLAGTPAAVVVAPPWASCHVSMRCECGTFSAQCGSAVAAAVVCPFCRRVVSAGELPQEAWEWLAERVDEAVGA